MPGAGARARMASEVSQYQASALCGDGMAAVSQFDARQMLHADLCKSLPPQPSTYDEAYADCVVEFSTAHGEIIAVP